MSGPQDEGTIRADLVVDRPDRKLEAVSTSQNIYDAQPQDTQEEQPDQAPAEAVQQPQVAAASELVVSQSSDMRGDGVRGEGDGSTPQA